MNKKIFVQLESPWKYTSGGMGKGLIDNPPSGIKYFFKRNKTIVSSQNRMVFTRFLKKIIMKISNIIPLIKSREVTIIDSRVKIIHCEHFLCENKKTSWVVDVEGFWQFFLGKNTKIKKEKIKKILLRKNCKKIISWTNYSKKDILNSIPELKGKVDTVYPTVKLPSFSKKKKKEITLLYVGRLFYEKGGFHVLRMMDKLTKEYSNINAIYVGEITSEEKEKFSKNKKIKILGMIPHKKLMEEIYPSTDIFIYPGYQDTFGFAYLEAMSFGLPIITIDKYNTREIIKVGKTGFLVDYNEKKINIKKLELEEEKLIGRFCSKAKILIENKKLREKMSKECIKTIKDGKFSIKERNKKLKKIYEEAIK